MRFFLALIPFALHAQDTTQVYPWRLSYFPYITASPNDGVMGLGRVVFFRQSRWDDRVSLHDEVAIEGGYSTKDAWLVRARGDFPRIAPGWRLQVIGQAGKEASYFEDVPATRQAASVEITRRLIGPLSVTLRGDATHVSYDNVNSYAGTTGTVSQSDFRGRVAFVLDQRDREYDTRSGSLVQVGGYITSSKRVTGEYVLVSGWLPLDKTTRLTARAGVRLTSSNSGELGRTLPAWEDGLVLGGGPQSNRALPVAARIEKKMYLVSVEIRHDLFTFPGGAFGVLAFVDGSGLDCDCIRLIDTPGPIVPTSEWTFGPGAGVSLRLLRNAILTATIAHGAGATRVYVSSGWSW